MRFLKVFLLFISVFFLGAMASAKETHGLTSVLKTQDQFHFQKSEPRNQRFADLVIEEIEDNTNENEDDSSFHGALNYPTSRLFAFHFSHEIASRSAVPTTGAKLLKYLTCRFILFRNIRL